MQNCVLHCVSIQSSQLISSADAEPKEVPLTDTVVADAAVRRPWRAEDFAGVAVLQLDDLVVDLHVADPRRRPLACGHVPVGCLCRNTSRISGQKCSVSPCLRAINTLICACLKKRARGKKKDVDFTSRLALRDTGVHNNTASGQWVMWDPVRRPRKHLRRPTLRASLNDATGSMAHWWPCWIYV